MYFLPEYVALAIFFVWLVVLTVLFYKFRQKIDKISDGSKKSTILDILNTLSDKNAGTEDKIKQISKDLDGLQAKSQFYIQKIGLIRFNPFNDTGGDQSFILSLVDNNDSGVVISGLHTRNGTRWYAKKVEHGKGLDYELSNDEKKAIKEAKKPE